MVQYTFWQYFFHARSPYRIKLDLQVLIGRSSEWVCKRARFPTITSSLFPLSSFLLPSLGKRTSLPLEDAGPDGERRQGLSGRPGEQISTFATRKGPQKALPNWKELSTIMSWILLGVMSEEQLVLSEYPFNCLIQMSWCIAIFALNCQKTVQVEIRLFWLRKGQESIFYLILCGASMQCISVKRSSLRLRGSRSAQSPNKLSKNKRQVDVKGQRRCHNKLHP